MRVFSCWLVILDLSGSGICPTRHPEGVSAISRRSRKAESKEHRMSSNGTNGAHGNGNGKGNGSTNGNGSGDKHRALNFRSNDPRWAGITRPYSYSDVVRLRGSIQIEYTLARLGAERLWNLMHTDAYVPALGAITGNQAIEMVQAGLKAIYGSGWQVAADGNTAGDVYPDQSLYPCDSAPNLVKRINR